MPPAEVPEDVLTTPFTDYLLRNAAADRPAFTCRTFPGPTDHTLTWPQVLARVRGVARELRRHTRPGDRVAIVARQDLGYVLAFLGTLYAGLVAVPLSVPTGRTHRARIEAAFADATPSVCLASKNLVEKVPHDVVLAVEDIEPDDAEPPGVVAMTDPAYLQYTSGSTRRPAGAVISHRALVASCWQSTRPYHADASSHLAGWVPFFHDMGLILLIGVPVFLGARSVFFTPMEFVRDPLRWLRLLADHPRAITAAPNFAFDLAAEAAGDLEDVDLSHVNAVLNGSEPVRAASVEAFDRAFAPFGLPRAAHKPCYGLAEATVFVASAGDEGPTVTAFDRDALRAGVAKPAEGGEALVASGLPYGQRVEIVDKETGAAMPDGEVGEIRVSGPNVADGYWGHPERGDVFTADGLRTGDLGFVHDGLLYVAGRLKDLIIVDGRNHYPQDIEATVEAAHPAVRAGRVAAFAVRDGRGEGVAVVAGSAATGDDVETAVRRAVSAGHDLPLRALWLVPPGAVPRTSSGKVSRAAARDRWWGENDGHG
ncbi:MAG TPA: fatty acyl-AMP ligase [Amycolatopsis sp.]|uniref:Fatty acyl-AMP ligase n=1 Tax=Amycolatopsis nalaikhensis TaxID=715472 RepID=A0ABY8XSS1_9PSEU|nr:fatty acyl-AMP ligase [Amycolatopsis sp. 2-2]WIV58734.1 fatty acyl-AMP ligase [Amycolatopsis sp. 2-2]